MRAPLDDFQIRANHGVEQRGGRLAYAAAGVIHQHAARDCARSR